MPRTPLLLALVLLVASLPRPARAASSPWDSVATTLRTADAFAGGVHRFNLPRRDIRLRVRELTVAPELAQGAWVAFTGADDRAMMMGDLVLTGAELGPVLAELARQGIDVSAIHNHLASEVPRLTYVHVHGMGRATDLARRLDRALDLTATPRPVAAAAAEPLGIDTTAVFAALGGSGRARGKVAQASFVLVKDVTLDGMPVPSALGIASPVNVQSVGSNRMVATGDFAVVGERVGGVLGALAANRITATALHSHMIGDAPKVYFIHFWADGMPADVLRGLRAAIDAGRE